MAGFESVTSPAELDREPTWIASFVGGPWPVSHPQARTAITVVVRILAYVALAYALDAIVPEAAQALVEPLLVALPVVMVPVAWLGVRRRLRRRTTSGAVPLVTNSRSLADYGIRTVTVVLQPGSNRVGLCLRQGRNVRITLNPYLPDRGLIEFVLAHEIAHALRNDSVRRFTSYVTAYSLFVAALLSFDYRGVPAGVAAAVILWTVPAWVSEIACDRIGVRRAGIDAFDTFAGENLRVLSLPPNRTVRRRIRRAFGRLTHPPMAWRTAIQRRLATR